ncbi:hypothetical protein V6N13_098541 [Hibiscus sabdariffa]|uniref:RNase H type-1 domain-containing protein n=1 Tax=Hibiscus sabdariffa TaxID=183260 RepID=A0ABR2EFP3_9ROSI
MNKFMKALINLPQTLSGLFLMEIDTLAHRELVQVRLSNDQWIPPPDMIKINMDARYSSTTNSSFSGCIFRDSDGLIMAACTYPNLFVSYSEMTEALACFQAMSLTIDLGFRRVIMESDDLTVTLKINSKSEDRSNIGLIIFNIKNKIEEFEQIIFMHVSRRLNNTAQVLARIGNLFPTQMVWTEEAPQPVEAAAAINRW